MACAKAEFELTDGALDAMIRRYYTREAGVRNLEREIAKVGAEGSVPTKIVKG